MILCSLYRFEIASLACNEAKAILAALHISRLTMKNKSLLLIILFGVVLFSSCKKDHYNVGNIHGISADGELLLPLASASYTMKDLMERFEIDSLITFADDGNMSFGFTYEHKEAISGSHLLYFKDWNYDQHFAIDNPFQGALPEPIDTVVSFSQQVAFEADHIQVMSALMKSGHFEFALESNVANLGQVVVTSSDIKDTQGRDLRFIYHPQTGQTGFDLVGLRYQTSQANTLTLNYEFHIIVHELDAPEIEIDAHIVATDLAIRQMTGYVEPYDSRNRIDTTFNLFPSNLIGGLEINGATLHLSERNTFDLDARLVVDTAMVFCEGVAPYSILEPLPVSVDLPSQSSFSEVFSHTLNGTLNAVGGHALSSSLFTVNPSGMSELVTVYDTCSIDVNVDVDIPFAFVIDHVGYMDTVDMQLSEIEMPEMIEKLAFELTFNSTLPLDLYGQFYMYDSQNECVTDTLLANQKVIAASFDGRPVTTTLSFEITEGRIESVLRSDRIIMQYELDTRAQDVTLNALQHLDLYVKMRAKYQGTLDLENN